MFPLKWPSEQVSIGIPSLSILFCVTKMLGQIQDSDISTIQPAHLHALFLMLS